MITLRKDKIWLLLENYENAGKLSLGEKVYTLAKLSGKNISKKHIDGPLGVRGRNSNNDLIREKLGWDYSMTLEEGIKKTYDWINEEQLGNKKVEQNVNIFSRFLEWMDK